MQMSDANANAEGGRSQSCDAGVDGAEFCTL